MDVEFLARLQFALTVMFHYIYAPLSIGLALVIAIIEGTYIITKDPLFKRSARFWTGILALTFVFGAVTGIVMEFEFGTNWASYSRFVGDVFGSPLAAEGIFSFFLESVFLAILVFGWDKVSEKMHFFATLMVCLGAQLSAVWIVAANSWMHTPAGFHMVGEGANRHAVITDFSAMFFNPSMLDRLIHVLLGAYLAGAFLVISVSAYYLLKKKFQKSALVSLKIASIVAFIALTLQLISGDSSARLLAKNHPSKLAAFEGIFHTQKNAPLSIFGIVNTEEERIDYQLAIPSLFSYLAYGNTEAEVQGLDTIPLQDRPNVSVIFQTYHAMVASWALMVMAIAILFWHFFRGDLVEKKWLLRLLVVSALLPQIGNQTGWVATEMGRYPWIVHNLMRISEGLSKTVSAHQVLSSILLFTFVYTALFILYIALFSKKIAIGPIEQSESTTGPIAY